MRHVIDINRAGLVDLIKASQGMVFAHKYIRRERYYKKGKLAWRYFYKDEAQRKQHRKSIDKEHRGSDVEHWLMTDLEKVYDSLKNELPPTRQWTEERISQQLKTRPQVTMSATYKKKHLKPSLDAEKKGRDPDRNVTQRVAMALGMLPEKVQSMINIQQIKMLDSSDPELQRRAEGGNPPPAVFMENRKGAAGNRLVLTADVGSAGINTAPHGDPHFGSALTLTEERVWHEVGRTILEKSKTDSRLLAKLTEFRALTQAGGEVNDEPVSATAEKNWQSDFAESFACLLSHPKQLAEQAPARYEWLVANGFGNSKLPKKADALKKQAASEWAWYSALKKSPARSVLDRLREGAPRDLPYRSEQDQFFQISVEGRICYMRVGPADASEEDGWSRMPDVIDKKTGLPVWNSDVSNRWNNMGAFKEIWDGDGNRLDPIMAMVYLQQGQIDTDTKVGRDWDAKFDAVKDADLNEIRKTATRNSWHIGRKVYLATGESMRGGAEEQKKRISAYQKERKEGTLEEKRGRLFSWLPHALTKAEFHAMTPTFAFEAVREAKEQPHTIKGKRDHDERGRSVPKLYAKVYELANADGGVMRLRVQESAEFEVGQTIQAPVIIEETVDTVDADGNSIKAKRNVLKWENVKLESLKGGRSPGYDPKTNTLYASSLDPKVLAKELGASQRDLLKRNNRLRQHQFQDPIMAALINPNNRAIRNASDLSSLVREAAKVGASAWVSIHFDSDIPAHAVHAKVAFDGGGSPLLLGDYWKRKLGMENPRISDLMRSGGTLRLQKPRERTIRKARIKIGDVVQFRVNGVELRGHLTARSTKGKRRYDITPLPGQESPPGWERMPETVSVSQVRSLPSDVDSERPNVRHRSYIQPDTDLLLYADDLETRTITRVHRRGQKNEKRVQVEETITGSGVVKIALPKDGSWTLAEIARAPGVSTNDKGELILDVNLIDQFREMIGGFVMDDHVQAKFSKIRERMMAGDGKSHLVPITDLVDPLIGNAVNIDGILKGLRKFIGDNRFTLGQHQVELLQAMADNGGRMLAAHFMGTGKTVSAVAAIKMMQNMVNADGSPSKDRPKKTIVIVPKSTASNWQSEVAKFTTGAATIVGSGTTPNALQMFKLPEKDERNRKLVGPKGSQRLETWAEIFERLGVKKAAYEADLEKERQIWLKGAPPSKEHPKGLPAHTRGWDPAKDPNDIIVVSQEYFTKHADELKRIGGFDAMVVDEAHGIQRQNRRSDQIMDYWNQDMKMMMLLTGTPITNTLNTLPRYIELLSKGKVLLGGKGTPKEQRENFESWAMIESAVMAERGITSSAKMDINPQAAGRVAEMAGPYVHVATSADVIDKVMPAVLLNENTPSEQSVIQASLYRGSMQDMLPSDRALFEQSAVLGEDENILGAEAQASVNAGRQITNTPAYKKPDGRSTVVIKVFDRARYNAAVKAARKSAKDRGRDPDEAADRVEPEKHTTNLEFKLPEWKKLTKIDARGVWPSHDTLVSHFWDGQEWSAEAKANEFERHISHMIGRPYDRLSGKSIVKSMTREEMNAMRKGERLNGISLNHKIENPDYGPEGVVCRGTWDEKTQKIKPITYKRRDARGKVIETVTVPVGLRFPRDPRKKSAGFYYAGGLPSGHAQSNEFQNDWNYKPPVIDNALVDSGTVRGAEKGQRPLTGREEMSIQTSPSRRRERLMFDLAMTTENAKTDDLQKYVQEVLDPSLGGNPDKQMIFFANAIGSGVRCVESKMRMMGYQDVNEALDPRFKSADDYVPSNGKYYITYLGKDGTLGDRDLNSEIFRKRKNADGSDSDMSLFVHRVLHGTDGKIKPGKIVEGWAPDQRKAIHTQFGIEVPALVRQDPETGEFHYLYESNLSDGRRGTFRKKADAVLTAPNKAAKTRAQKALADYISDDWSDESPLTERQVQVFNNCQMMVASDAAQVGLNWGNATDLVMYDSLFSPMEEWQRITRAARMLPPAVRTKFKKHFADLKNRIDRLSKRTGLKEYDGDVNGAMSIVTDMLDKMPKVREALVAAGVSPTATAESFLAQEALDRIRELRPIVEQRLRTQGRKLVTAPEIPGAKPFGGPQAPGKQQFIMKREITSSDITNEILEGKDPATGRPYISEFEKKILRSRKYIVHVKRLTTSVDVPIYQKVKETYKDPETGRKRTRTVQKIVGTQTEFPSRAEASKLNRARAKQVPFESWLADMQQEFPTNSDYDFEVASPGQMAAFDSPTSLAEQKRAREKSRKESEAFYGRKTKKGPTLRQREQMKRRALAKKLKEQKAQQGPSPIQLQRRREAQERARKRRMKKSMPLDYI